MEKLYQIARMVNKHERTLATMIPDNESSPLKKLTTIVFSKQQISDEECMNRIYGKKNIPAYKSLKARLYSKLINVLLLQHDDDVDDNATTQQMENLKNIIASNILLAEGPNNLGFEMLEKAIVVSIKKHFTDNVILAVRRLLAGYGSGYFNKYKYNKYLEIQKKYIDIYMWELKAHNYYIEMQNDKIKSSIDLARKFTIKSKQYINELDNAGVLSSPIFNFNKYRIKAIYFEYSKKYEDLLQITNQAIVDFSVTNFKTPLIISNIYTRKIFALIQLNRLKDAIEFGMFAISKTNSTSNSWFRLNYYLCKAFIYDYKYKDAIEILVKVYKNANYRKLSPTIAEVLNTTLGYLYLLIDSGRAKNDYGIKNNMPNFKLGKFVNSVPVYSKDKYRFNISILLLQVGLLLLRKDYNPIIDRIDSLNQYAYRYLRNDDTFRSNCMIKMVIQMTKADFNPVRTERYTADLLKQLKSVKLAGSGENIEIEVIPFEVLWEIMLKSLKN